MESIQMDTPPVSKICAPHSCTEPIIIDSHSIQNTFDLCLEYSQLPSVQSPVGQRITNIH